MKDTRKKKGKKAITETDMEENIHIGFSETETFTLFYMPSSIIAQDAPNNQQIIEMNNKYSRVFRFVLHVFK